MNVEYVGGFNAIEGMISYSGTETGPILVRAGANKVTINTLGPYSIGGLQHGQNYNVTAFLDINLDGVWQPGEPEGAFSGNPIIYNGGLENIDITLGQSPDVDNDGMSDIWELVNNLNVGVDDSQYDNDTDGLSNIVEYGIYTAANTSDTDGDGLTDGSEYNSGGTNPLLVDTDGDGMPDKWEMDNGLDPLRDDRGDDRDSDFLTNWEEYAAGLNPAIADSNSDGTPDYRTLRGNTTWEGMYDRNDRLLGVRHERGASFGYRYDGNGNPIRQTKMGRDTDGDVALPPGL